MGKFHSMTTDSLQLFCKSKAHPLITDSGVDKVHIVPDYDRGKSVSTSEKRDKLFNYKRPTAEIVEDYGLLYVFPGADYVRHLQLIYKQLGYSVTTDTVTVDMTRHAVMSVFPEIPSTDFAVIGYVDAIAGETNWHGNKDISWKVEYIEGHSVLFIGVTFSYWGNIIYYVVEQLVAKSRSIIYVGKLGSLCLSDVPNRTIASGDTSKVDGSVVNWDNIFERSTLISLGAHVTVPSVLDETEEWFVTNRSEYRFVDPEIGWAAKSCEDNRARFSYLHLVTDNLCGDFMDDLTNERLSRVVNKRLQYVGIIKAILWSAISGSRTSVYSAVLEAQQRRVDRGILKPLQRDWDACLSFARHTNEESMEVIRELPRREWKEQAVDPNRVLEELADTQIQLLTTLAYSGFSEEELRGAIMRKLNTKRPDWK